VAKEYSWGSSLEGEHPERGRVASPVGSRELGVVKVDEDEQLALEIAGAGSALAVVLELDLEATATPTALRLLVLVERLTPAFP
jgi:hypothetical protein